jgi:hypothetical protein
MALKFDKPGVRADVGLKMDTGPVPRTERSKRMIKPKLELDRLTDDGVENLGTTVQTQMTANATQFPGTTANVTALGTAVTKFVLSNQKAKDGKLAQQALIDTKDADRTDVEGCLRTLAGQVNDVAKGNAEVIHAAGMASSSEGGPVTMEQVMNLVVSPGDAEGSVDWMCDPQKGALFLVETSPDVTPRVWTKQDPAKKSSGMIPGLPSATRQWVRVAAKGSHNTGGWSDPALVLVP